jgi:hypothetical protein
MATALVQVAPGLPTNNSKSSPISAKREFEKIILDICRLAGSAKGLAGLFMEALISQSQSNADKQWYYQLAGSVSQVAGTAFGLTRATPEAFQIWSKVGDVFKGFSDINQSSYQMGQQKVQHANTQWQTLANGLQDLIRNLEAAKQRLQQQEDATNR